MPHTGSCFCGAIRYQLNAEPLIVHACHCTDCQRQIGGAFAINAVIEAANVELLAGAPVITTVTAPSGKPHDIYRCADCGSPVWSDYQSRKSIFFIRVATLDEPARLPPDVHIYTASKLPFFELPEGANAHEGFYDPREVWSAETMSRWRAATAG